jgi:uncharacterized protein YhhL (DUF1145 family)
MPNKEKHQKVGIYPRYAMVGAAIGLYYGFFYKGSETQPDFGITIILSIFAGLLTVIIRSIKRKRPFKEMAQEFLQIFIVFFVFMASLELRIVADQFGGRAAVAALTTITGMGLGLLIAKMNLGSKFGS